MKKLLERLKELLGRGSKGFTLIELLIVIAIIGILAAIVLVSLNDARESARDTQRVGNIRNAQLALELYFDDKARYPSDDDVDDVTVIDTCVDADDDDPGVLQLMDVIKMVGVQDPLSGGSYFYGANADPATNYVLLAVLEDTNDSAFTTDVDGTVYNCDCTDANNGYCVQP